MQRRRSTVLGCEITVYNHTIGYAATFDLWDIDPDGNAWILDWKTSKGIYTSHAVQQVAYLHAEHAIVRSKSIAKPGEEKWEGQIIPWGPKMADRIGLVHVTPARTQLYPILQAAIPRMWEVFQSAAIVKDWLLIWKGPLSS